MRTASPSFHESTGDGKRPQAMPFPPLAEEDLAHVLAHTRTEWDKIRGGRLFVTGATGFFGIWLLETFAYANRALDLGASLVGLTRAPGRFLDKAPHVAELAGVHLHQGDLRDFIFPPGSFSHVVHVGTAPDARLAPSEILEIMTGGTRRTLALGAAAGAQRVLFVSSGAVYGPQPPGMTQLEEGYAGPLNPQAANHAYAMGKRLGEHEVVQFSRAHDMEATIARCFSFVGPHLPSDGPFAIGNFIRDGLRGDPITVRNGMPYRSYLYMADLAIWLWTILFRGTPCRPYNVGSDREITIAALARTVASVLPSPPGGGSSLSSQPGLASLAPDEHSPVSRYVPSIHRARTELGLQPIISLEEAIRKTADYATRACLRCP